jgi:hypothetical protein
MERESENSFGDREGRPRLFSSRPPAWDIHVSPWVAFWLIDGLLLLLVAAAVAPAYMVQFIGIGAVLPASIHAIAGIGLTRKYRYMEDGGILVMQKGTSLTASTGLRVVGLPEKVNANAWQELRVLADHPKARARVIVARNVFSRVQMVGPLGWFDHANEPTKVLAPEGAGMAFLIVLEVRSSLFGHPSGAIKDLQEASAAVLNQVVTQTHHHTLAPLTAEELAIAANL